MKNIQKKMNWKYDDNIIDNHLMIAKHQLAYILNSILCNYIKTRNLERFYRKLHRHSKNISLYISNDVYIDYKIDIKKMYDDMINGEFDETIVNDCIKNIQKIVLDLLVFE
jgi:hypothetical protein